MSYYTQRGTADDEQPYNALAYAILVQAVTDVKALQAAGVIVDWKAISQRDWPRGYDGKPKKYLGTINHPEAIGRLLYFFNDDVIAEWLEMLGSSIAPSRILAELKLHGQQQQRARAEDELIRTKEQQMATAPKGTEPTLDPCNDADHDRIEDGWNKLRSAKGTEPAGRNVT